ncbi:rab proteins geranylgeranyltransferase component A-like [Oppia nitens]|uniref:rab proteins geranylgeranyltransferase component A-like n=1 Tax=Oppia nitens TaxID=1686743 RepID=UPI0023D9DB9A|nr:rab proteins geranylgeranyltransferase component A-like [Oppia nitens]
MPIVKNLYNFTPDITDNCDETDDKPKVLWSVYYNQHFSRCVQPIDLPENVWTTTPPVSELDFDLAINEARTLFSKMFPNDEFLPRASDPNEILFDGQTNDIEMNEPNNQPIDEPIVNNNNNN